MAVGSFESWAISTADWAAWTAKVKKAFSSVCS